MHYRNSQKNPQDTTKTLVRVMWAMTTACAWATTLECLKMSSRSSSKSCGWAGGEDINVSSIHAPSATCCVARWMKLISPGRMRDFSISTASGSRCKLDSDSTSMPVNTTGSESGSVRPLLELATAVGRLVSRELTSTSIRRRSAVISDVIGLVSESGDLIICWRRYVVVCDSWWLGLGAEPLLLPVVLSFFWNPSRTAADGRT